MKDFEQEKGRVSRALKSAVTDNVIARNADLAPRIVCSEMERDDHFVQFYEDDGFLIESVGAFIGGGLGAGDGAIVIGTQAHREALASRLKAQGIDLEAVQSRGQYVSLDAAETLSKFMVRGLPDEALFNKVIGGLVKEMAKDRSGLRAFGEMVALLWADGNGAAAIRLEELWNKLGKTHTFSLFCAYPMDDFAGESNGESFSRICKEHAHVIPVESYSAKTSAADRLRTIALLQQKAASLETEIAKQRETEKALLRADDAGRLLTAIVESSDDAIASKDLTGVITSWNKGAERLFGYTEAEMIGTSVTILIPEDRLNEEPGILQKICAGDRVDHYETVRRRKDGTLVDISLTVSPIKDAAGRVVGASKIARDITDRIRAKEKLEQTVAERTAQLRDTVAELEAFSYSIAHDMRAPLRAMTSFSRLLREDFSETLPDTAKDYIRRIAVSAERLDRLILDVLHYSRSTRGDWPLEAVDVEKLTREIIDSYSYLQESGGKIFVQSPMARVVGNRAALTQCISNLLSNAVKFVSPGMKPNVRIWAEPNHQCVRLWFEDNGIGISEEGQKRIFHLFQRLHPATEFEGSGIGLTIVRKAVERMGGRIGVESKVGAGSRFWLELKKAD